MDIHQWLNSSWPRKPEDDRTTPISQFTPGFEWLETTGEWYKTTLPVSVMPLVNFKEFLYNPRRPDYLRLNLSVVVMMTTKNDLRFSAGSFSYLGGWEEQGLNLNLM